MDVDAFVASVMLSSLLKKHLILYKTEPVCGYESLKAGFSRLDPSIRNVFFIGCGAAIDVEELLGLDVDSTEEGYVQVRPKIHVFDRNRPWHLNNLFGSELVYCYEDGTSEDIDEYRAAYTFLASTQDAEDSNELESSDSINSEEDNEDEDEIIEVKQGKRVRRRAIDSDDENDEEINEEEDVAEKLTDDDNDDNENNIVGGGAGAGAGGDGNTQEDEEQFDLSAVRHKKKRKTQRATNIKLLEEYYRQGNYIATTNAVQIYTLLTLIGETSSMMLWLSIVGLTSIETLNPQLYKILLPSLKNEMHRLNQVNNHNHSSASNGSAKAAGGIKFYGEPDFSLFLLRQWSLYESMIHSSYVSAKLFLWREDGRKKLHKMLAKVGITLQDAKESWVHTKPVLKRELKSRLDSVSGSYGIEGITRDGVVREFGLAGSMSAGDCVESIAAYLEMGKTDAIFPNKFNKSNGGSGSSKSSDSTSAGAGAGEDDPDAESKELSRETYEAWVRNFWIAWDSYDIYDRLMTGCEQAKLLQTAVVSTANFIFDKNLPKDLRSFRMVIVQDAPAIEVFYNPLSLQRLASWVSEGCAEIHSSNTPFVLAVLNEPRDVYLVIGMGGHRSRDFAIEDVISNHNHFGRQFQATARAINAEVKIDAFESAIIEVSRLDLPRFLEALDAQIQSE